MTSKKQQYFATQKQRMSIKAHASFLSATVLVVAGTACSGVAMDDEEPSGGGGAGGPADGAGTGGNESGGSSGGSETGGASAGGGGADAGGGDGTGGAGAGGAANPGGSGGGGFYPTCDAEHYDHDSSPTTACLPWSDCLEGTRVEVAGTATTDRVCAPCLGNSFSDDVNQAYCLGFQDCYSGQYVSTAGTPSSDRVCSSCPDGSFSDDDNEPACTPHDDCDHPWFIAEFGNEAEDNQCGNGIRQFGSALSTHGSTVAVDAAGNVVVGGIILSLDPYVRVYTASGGLALNETFGGGNVADYVTDLTVDTNGDIFMVGELGSGSSPTSNGFVARWTQEGDSLWTTMFGPVSGGKFQSIAIDEGGAVYAVGSLYSTAISNDQAILRVYTPDGDSDWGTTFGSGDSHDGASGVAVDALGNVVVVGTTSGVVQGATLGGDDAFIRLYDDLEAELWTEQFGTDGNDRARGVAVAPNGDIVVVGSVGGDLEGTSAGGTDAFIRIYDVLGDVTWTRQFGTPAGDQAESVAVDSAGNLYVFGTTAGDLEGTSIGASDVFVRVYDPLGEVMWTRQIGSTEADGSGEIAVTADGDVFIAGSTQGNLGKPISGDWNAFVTYVAPPSL